VRLRGTSLSSPAAIASDTLIRLIGNASPDANNAEYFMKSRRVVAGPEDSLSIPLLHFGGAWAGPKWTKSADPWTNPLGAAIQRLGANRLFEFAAYIRRFRGTVKLRIIYFPVTLTTAF
jgi:hypothetical protein